MDPQISTTHVQAHILNRKHQQQVFPTTNPQQHIFQAQALDLDSNSVSKEGPNTRNNQNTPRSKFNFQPRNKIKNKNFVQDTKQDQLALFFVRFSDLDSPF